MHVRSMPKVAGEPMMGFWVSTAAVVLAAWFGYVAGRASRRVPTGTFTPTHTGHCGFKAPRGHCFPPGCNDFPECDHRY